MKKSIILLLLVTFAIPMTLFADEESTTDESSNSIVTYDKKLRLEDAVNCYLNFMPKTDLLKHPFFTKKWDAFILPEFKNIKDKAVYIIKRSNSKTKIYDEVYRLDLSNFNPAEYKTNVSIYEANISAEIDGSYENLVLSLIHHPEGDDDGIFPNSEKELLRIKKLHAERDKKCNNYECGNWEKNVYFGYKPHHDYSEVIYGTKLLPDKKGEGYVIYLMMSSIISGLRERNLHPDYTYEDPQLYEYYKAKMKVSCPNIFLGL